MTTKQRFDANRRQWLQAAAAGLAGAGLSAAGCRPRAAGSRVLKVFNWSDYIHPDLIPRFERDHECTVVYDNFSSDSELEARLATGGGAYDVVFPSDRTMHALLAKGLLQPIDHGRLPNLSNLDPDFLNRKFDPGNRHSVPYFWGTVAVGLRSDLVSEKITGCDALCDERYRGRITMLDDPENVVGIVLKQLGLPLNSVAQDDLRLAQDWLLRQRPLVQAYTSDSYKERLIAGEAWLSLGWSGDLMQAVEVCEQVQVVVPRQGTLIWLDNMAIPRAATNVELAHRFIDYLLDADVAAENAQKLYYATPNRAALAKLPAQTRADESIYPPRATLDRCEWLANRGQDVAKIEAVWRTVKA